MQVPLKIAFEGGLASSEALRARIEQEAVKLEQFSDRIIACRVAVIGRSGRKRHGDLYGVRLQITLPGKRDIMIDRNPDAAHAHQDPYVAVRDAFNAARRRPPPPAARRPPPSGSTASRTRRRQDSRRPAAWARRADIP